MSITMSGYSVIDDYSYPQLDPNPTVPGTAGVRIMGGLRKGSVATCLLYVASRFNREVEPLVQSQGQWGYERRKIAGSASWSDHAAGAAVDLNATLHPSGADATFTSRQLTAIGSIEAVVSSALEWGGRWAPDSLDSMHWQVRDGCAGGLVDELAVRIGVWAPWPPAPPNTAPPYPFVRGDGRYFGPYSGPAESISGSGHDDARYRPALAQWQAQAAAGGFGPVTPDGYYGPVTAAAARRVQSAHRLNVDGLIGWDTWHAVWS